MTQYHLRVLDQLATQTEDQQQTDLTQIVLYVWTLVGLLTLAGFILYDWRQGFPRMIYVRDQIRRLCRRVKNLKAKWKRKHSKEGEKISGEEQLHSSKATITTFELQKSITDTDIVSVQQTANTTPSFSEEFRNQVHIQDETPQVDLKQMFERDKKGKDKSKGKSKSKLRDRVKIKKSELQAEDNQEQNPCDLSEDVENSVDATEQ